MSKSLVRKLRKSWNGRLAHYQLHRNDEHLSALVEETSHYVGLHLDNDLSRSAYWADVRLGHTAAVLLFLVDKGVVERTVRRGRRVLEPLPHAESWVRGQAPLRPYRAAILELISALRHDLGRRTHLRN
ncbi:MAG: hypothetical protein ACP5XB_24470 [Isosphaeraceae bacterium]